MDVTHTSVTVDHYNIDSGGGEVSLKRTYQNQGRIRVWKSLLCDNHFSGRQQTITAISKSSPRMKSSVHHWQHRLVDNISKAPIILYIKSQTFLFQLHFRSLRSDNYKCVNCFNICIKYKIMDKMSHWYTGSSPSYGFIPRRT